MGISFLIKSISIGFRKRVGLKKLFSKTFLDRWILVLVSLGSFLPWVKFPLSGGINTFNLHSPIFLSWGLLFLPTAILTIVRTRWFLFLLLVIVLFFPLQIHWDYSFLKNTTSEIVQKQGIKQLAKEYLYDPDIVYDTPTETTISDITDLWNNPWSRFTLTVESLGIGFWMAFIGTIIISRRLGVKKFMIALLFSLILSLPGIVTNSFLILGRNAFLIGNYSKSLDMYKSAMRINQSFGNKTLNELELYHLWVGESLFHMGIKDAPQVYFFLGKNLEGIKSFIESKEMYQKSLNLPPARTALARTMVEEAVFDFREKNFGSAMDRLEEAFKLDNNQVEALFYAAYISFILEDRQLASYYSSLTFDRCKEKLLLSDLYNILGDAYNKTERLVDSRTMYNKSINTFDNVRQVNFHAWKGFAGW